MNHLDAAVRSPVFLSTAHVRLGGSIIGDAEFPVGVELIEDRIKAAAGHLSRYCKTSTEIERVRHGGNSPLNFEPVPLVKRFSSSQRA